MLLSHTPSSADKRDASLLPASGSVASGQDRSPSSCQISIIGEKVLGELPKIRYAKWKLDEPTYDLLTYLLTPFEVLSSEDSMEMSCLVPEMEELLNLILYLVDAETC